MNNMLTTELILHEHNYTLPGAGERRSQEEVRHGARDSDCCPADSLATVTMSHVEEKQEKETKTTKDARKQKDKDDPRTPAKGGEVCARQHSVRGGASL